MPAKYAVCLSDAQRHRLDCLTRTGTHPARAIQHARILLLADEDPTGGPAWSGEKVADALGCGIATVARTRRRFAREGFEQALRVRKDVPGRTSRRLPRTSATPSTCSCGHPYGPNRNRRTRSQSLLRARA